MTIASHRSSTLPTAPSTRPDQRVRRWYVTARHHVTRLVGGAKVEMPFAESHLKEIGAHTTACGISTVGWTTFWEADPRRVAELCRTCAITATTARS